MYNKKTPIKIFDKDLNYVAEIDDYKSLIFKRCYSSYGTFSIVIAVDKKNTGYLKEKNIIMIDRNTNKAGIILNKQIKLDDKGQEILTVKGFTLNCILSRRKILDGFKLSNIKLDELIYKLLNENIINSSNIKRNIANLMIDKVDHDFKSVNYEVNNYEKVLGNEVSELCKNNDLGYKINVDFKNKKLVFSLYEGKDLTKENMVIFSPRLGNAKEQDYEYNEIEGKNVCFIKYNDTLKEFGEASGLDRNETYIEYNNKDDTVKTYEDIANDELLKNKIIDSLTCTIVPNKVFIYERDYDLGDKVIIENPKWGIKKELRIFEIEEVYELENKINITFGEPQQVLAAKIKSKLNDIDSKTYNKTNNEIIIALEKRITELENKSA